MKLKKNLSTYKYIYIFEYNIPRTKTTVIRSLWKYSNCINTFYLQKTIVQHLQFFLPDISAYILIYMAILKYTYINHQKVRSNQVKLIYRITQFLIDYFPQRYDTQNISECSADNNSSVKKFSLRFFAFLDFHLHEKKIEKFQINFQRYRKTTFCNQKNNILFKEFNTFRMR